MISRSFLRFAPGRGARSQRSGCAVRGSIIAPYRMPVRFGDITLSRYTARTSSGSQTLTSRIDLSVAPSAASVSPAAIVPELERDAIRRVALRIVPLLMVCYFFAYLDRVNLSFAALQMNKALGLSSTAYGLGAGLFFLSYCLCEIPSNLLLYRVGATRWIARIMFTLGLCATAMAFIQGKTSFYVVRLALGAAEAGFYPGVLFFSDPVVSCRLPGARAGRVHRGHSDQRHHRRAVIRAAALARRQGGTAGLAMALPAGGGASTAAGTAAAASPAGQPGTGELAARSRAGLVDWTVGG